MHERSQVKIIDRAAILHLVSKTWERESEVNNISNSRLRKNVMHRYAFIVACRHNTPLTCAEIGRVVRKDHSTTVHATKQHETNIRFDSDYRSAYETYTVEVSAISEMLLEDEEAIYPKDINELRVRLISLSKRIRGHIIEKKEIETKLIKTRREKNLLREHNRDLVKRNDLLDNEVKRLKRLL